MNHKDILEQRERLAAAAASRIPALEQEHAMLNLEAQRLRKIYLSETNVFMLLEIRRSIEANRERNVQVCVSLREARNAADSLNR